MRSFSVVLVGTQNSGNLGATARVMANFGFSRLVLVSPFCSVDEEARRRAKHAQSVLKNRIEKKSFDSLRKDFDLLIATTGKIGNDYNINRSPVLLPELPDALKGFKGRVGLVFGSEEKGLSNEMIGKCDFIVTIPASGKYPVLNLSHAVGVVLYELSKNSELRKGHKLASNTERELMLNVVYEIIDSLKFRSDSEKKIQKKIWKRVLGKSMITKRESFAVLGLLKKIRKKI